MSYVNHLVNATVASLRDADGGGRVTADSVRELIVKRLTPRVQVESDGDRFHVTVDIDAEYLAMVDGLAVDRAMVSFPSGVRLGDELSPLVRMFRAGGIPVIGNDPGGVVIPCSPLLLARCTDYVWLWLGERGLLGEAPDIEPEGLVDVEPNESGVATVLGTFEPSDCDGLAYVIVTGLADEHVDLSDLVDVRFVDADGAAWDARAWVALSSAPGELLVCCYDGASPPDRVARLEIRSGALQAWYSDPEVEVELGCVRVMVRV